MIADEFGDKLAANPRTAQTGDEHLCHLAWLSKLRIPPYLKSLFHLARESPDHLVHHREPSIGLRSYGLPRSSYLFTMHNKAFGNEGERIAGEYLQGLGHTLLARNWRSGHLEIDLVTREGQTIVFTEVKARSGDGWGQPEEFIDADKMDRLVRAATAWLTENEHTGEFRFDVVAITRNDQDDTRIRHIPDAFFPYP